MLIPKGGNVYTASVLMNYYYNPAVAAKVEDYVNYICPVKGADKVLKKTDPAVAKNPLIFPTDEMLSNTHQFDASAAQNDDYKTKFAQLTGS
jgi:spermidine/putrescine transport system substrate-binding protein